MRRNFIFVDLENVQPDNLEILNGLNFKIVVFVGCHQKKISFELASAMQTLGENAEYVKIEGSGPNALDFHIAFYIGKFSEKERNSCFYIISKDTGFDPLIRHSVRNGVYVRRYGNVFDIPFVKKAPVAMGARLASGGSSAVASLSGIPPFENKKIVVSAVKDEPDPDSQPIQSKTKSEKMDVVVAFLRSRGKRYLPKTHQALFNSIDSLFKRKVPESELSALIKTLIEEKIVISVNEKVRYKLPPAP